MTTKANLLAQIVSGKTLLTDAPTRRDVILRVYGIDIDDPKITRTSISLFEWSNRYLLAVTKRACSTRNGRIMEYIKRIFTLFFLNIK
ncbi:MAG: hypothetical protein WBQ25_26710 [Nitrososphaeraceae archaeon]